MSGDETEMADNATDWWRKRATKLLEWSKRLVRERDEARAALALERARVEALRGARCVCYGPNDGSCRHDPECPLHPDWRPTK